MDEKKKFFRKLRKHWVTIWLFAAALSLCGVFSYARFGSGQNYVKRVIQANSDSKVFFSSNYLKINKPKYPNTVPAGYSEERYFDISIYNYDKTNATSFYHSTINYTLTATLKKNKGADSYDAGNDAVALSDIFGNEAGNVVRIYRLVNGTVSGAPILTPLGKSQTSASIVEQLVPDESTGSAVNTYRVVLPACVIDKDLYVELVADPAQEYSDLPSYIGGYFYVKSNSINLTTAWTGAFNDDQSILPSGYDGFNYSITGNGTAEKVLSWDKSLLEPNRMEILEQFHIDVTDATKYTDAGDVRSIRIELSSAENGGRYNIQFYVSSDVSASTARSRLDAMSWTGEEGLASKVWLSDPE